MLKESFLGHNPSHFTVSPIIKAYIIADSFLWSAWNLIMPIFAVFIVNNINKSSIELAAAGYSIHLITRVIFELLSGSYLAKSTDRKKFIVTIFGMSILSVAYLGFSVSSEIFQVFVFYAVAGMALGIATPAKNALFSMHLDKNKESAEWGITDAVSFICMALATALGGFIAGEFGFKMLFYVAAIINILSIFPYISFINRKT